MDPELVDELIIWRLVLDKAITYSEIESLNFIDALKMTAILDFKRYLEKKEQEKLDKTK